MLKIVLVVLFLGPFLGIEVEGEHETYKGYQVYEVVEDEDNEYYPNVNRNVSILSEKRMFLPGKVCLFRSYLVHGDSKVNFLRDLDIMNAPNKLTVKNLGDLIKDEMMYIEKEKWSLTDFHKKTLLTYEELSEYLEKIVLTKNPENKEKIAELEVLGNTYGDRVVYGVKISSNHAMEKPIVFFEAGLHGRDWTAIAAARYLIHQLVQNFTHNADLLKNVDFYVMPMSNPDGFEYARTNDRLWIKNRGIKNSSSKCEDLRKDFGFPLSKKRFSEIESKDSPSELTPFSELETRHIRSAGMKYKDRIKAFVTIQSIGSLVLYPWGYKKDKPFGYKTLQLVGNRAAEAMNKFANGEFKAGQSSKYLYDLEGGVDDYFMETLKVKMAFTVKLSSATRYSYALPPQKVSSIVQEAYEGFKVIASHALIDLGRKRKRIRPKKKY